MDDVHTSAYWVDNTCPPTMDSTSLTHSAVYTISKDFISKEEFSKYKKDVDTQLNTLKDKLGNSCYYNYKTYVKGASSMFKKIRLVVVYGFAIFGLFTLVNDTILTNYKDELSRSYNYVTEYFKINFINIKYHAENWDNYSPEFKSKLWDSLSKKERINLMTILNTYKIKRKDLEEFEKTF